jgi:hypothetical protein
MILVTILSLFSFIVLCIIIDLLEKFDYQYKKFLNKKR